MTSTLLKFSYSFFCFFLSNIAVSASDEKAKGAALPPQLTYTSTFKNYLSYSDQSTQSWIDANNKVADIGGWRTYTNEATEESQSTPNIPRAHHKDNK